MDLNVNFSSLDGELIQDPNVNFSSLGDLRYASYPVKDGTMEFPDIEPFQCYDNVKAAAKNYGKPKWRNKKHKLYSR
ncbi:beta-amylase 1, chloroplastic, partial [Tanacetum coccineum]